MSSKVEVCKNLVFCAFVTDVLFWVLSGGIIYVYMCLFMGFNFKRVG